MPLVRLPSNDEVIIKRVLDAGAGGIIIPQVNSEADLIKAIESTQYPVQGKRGAGLARAQGYGRSFDNYKEIADEGLIVVAQIEHIEAFNNLDSILNVPGLDSIIIGPYDLSASMGKAGLLDDKEVAEIIDSILKRSIDRGISCGIHIIEPEITELTIRISQGFNFIAYSLDIRMLDASAKEALDLTQ